MLLQWTQNQSGLNVSTKMELFLFTYTQINSKKSDQQNNTGAFSSLLAKNIVYKTVCGSEKNILVFIRGNKNE